MQQRTLEWMNLLEWITEKTEDTKEGVHCFKQSTQRARSAVTFHGLHWGYF